MKRLHLLKLILKKQVHSSSYQIVHEPSGRKGVAKSTRLLANRVEEIIHNEFLRDPEWFRHSHPDPATQTQQEAQRVGSSHCEGKLIAEVAILENLHRFFALLSHRIILYLT